MNWINRITTNPKILGGKPIIKGTRISVEFIIELIASKMTPDDIVKAYPHLSLQDVLAAIHYALDLVKGEETIVMLDKEMSYA